MTLFKVNITHYKKILLFAFYIIISGCSSKSDTNILVLSGFTMGTSYNVQIVIAENTPKINKPILAEEIDSILKQTNNLMSTWLPDSELSKLNRSADEKWFKVSADTLFVIELAQLISEETNGAFDITVGPLVELWGFGVTGTTNTIPTDDEIIKTLRRTGYRKIKIDHEQMSIKKVSTVYIDLSAIAKGFAVDKIAEHLDTYKLLGYLVEVGGEIRTSGSKGKNSSWKIAIESPLVDLRTIHKIINITDHAIATSGDYRNYFEKNGKRYSHTIDPVNGKPITNNLASVTVIDLSAARADAIATALTVMGPERGFAFCEKNNIAAYFIYKENNLFKHRVTRLFEKYIVRND